MLSLSQTVGYATLALASASELLSHSATTFIVWAMLRLHWELEGPADAEHSVPECLLELRGGKKMGRQCSGAQSRQIAFNA